jgi:O-antigen/teichoic acid export membrane protein
LITNLVGRAGTFAIAVIQARLLGKSGYGELGIVLSTLTLFSLFSSAAGGQTCTKCIAESRHSNAMSAERIAGLSIATTAALSGLIVIAIFVWGKYLAVQALMRVDLAPLLWLAGISLAFQALTGTISGILLGLHEFRRDGILRLAQIAAWLPLTAWLTGQRGTFGAMLAYTLSQGIGLAVYGAYTARVCRRKKFAIRFSGMWAESGVLLRFSLPMMLHGLLCIPTVWLCNVILARQPGGYAALGGYTAATQFRTIVIQIPMLIQGVVWPVMAEQYGKRKMKSFVNLYQSSFEVLWALGLLAALPMIAFGGNIMRLFGRSFEADQQIMVLVMSITCLSLLSSFAGIALQITNNTWRALYANIAYSVVSIVCALIWIPWYGARGLATAFIMSTAVQLGVLLLLVWLMVPELHRLTNFGLAGISVALCWAMQLASREPSFLVPRVGAVLVFMTFVFWRGLLGPSARVLRSLSAMPGAPTCT